MARRYWFRGRWYDYRAISFEGFLLIFAYIAGTALLTPDMKQRFGIAGALAWIVVCTVAFAIVVAVTREPDESPRP
jgi:hypothetical protein